MKGVTSVFFPTVIKVSHIADSSKTDAENISEDWQRVGSYIYNAIDITEKPPSR